MAVLRNKSILTPLDEIAPSCDNRGENDSTPVSPSKRPLRTANRHIATRMHGRHNSTICTPRGAHPHPVGTALQCRTPSHVARARHPAAACVTASATAAHRHRLPAHQKVRARTVLGGLHHEYGLDEKAA